MAFKRILVASKYASKDKLNSDLAAIGVLLAAPVSQAEPNIEDTLMAASIEGIQEDDYRLLSLVADWFEIHSVRINVDRLTKIVEACNNWKIKAWWTALAQTKTEDWRFKKLQKIYAGERFDLMGEGSAFQIERKGEDSRFSRTVLRVPDKLLRNRPSDILTPELLAKRHRAYYFRTMMGPSYRADMWAIFEQQPDLSSAELARRTYGSFPTAWEVKRDTQICLGEK